MYPYLQSSLHPFTGSLHRGFTTLACDWASCLPSVSSLVRFALCSPVASLFVRTAVVKSTARLWVLGEATVAVWAKGQQLCCALAFCGAPLLVRCVQQGNSCAAGHRQQATVMIKISWPFLLAIFTFPLLFRCFIYFLLLLFFLLFLLFLV